jgi:hypothetical protein
MVNGHYKQLKHKMSEYIFNKPLLNDIKDLNDSNIIINISWLRSLIPGYNPINSGIWQPVFVSVGAQDCEPLIRAKTGPVSSYSVCDCSDSSVNPATVEDILTESSLCSYCGNDYGISWKLYDDSGASSLRLYSGTCCGGACDTRFKSDDYIPKIPVLNHSYITGAYDWKYKNEYPACNNPGLGKDKFIIVNDSERKKIFGPQLCIDWKIRETISEINYSPINSSHNNEYSHRKSYNKSKIVSHTCGNFILTQISSTGNNWYVNNYPILSGLIGSQISGDISIGIIPSKENFANIPYGFDKKTYDNIFIHNEKIASHWKWNYESGILCWYRYYDIHRSNDKRPIPSIDLYISPGDVFWANNDGPEPLGDPVNPTGVVSSIQNCPSGLKVLRGAELECIIPSGSKFLYISANIYNKFYDIYTKIYQRTDSYYEAMNIAAVLSTSPSYDEITVDLLKENLSQSYSKNIYDQLDLFNRQMQSGTSYDSVSRLNYISDRSELIQTLASKYGEYLWIPPNTDQNILFSNEIENKPFALDIDFNLSVDPINYKWSTNNTCNPITSCADRSFRKIYSYEQNIGFPGLNVSTTINDSIRYAAECVSGTITEKNHGFFSSIYLNNTKIKSILSSSGCVSFTDNYPRISLSSTSTFCDDCDKDSSFYLIPNAESVECANHSGALSFCYSKLAKRLNNSPPADYNRLERKLSDGTLRFKRGYRSLFFNPHIDNIAFHSQGGVFLNSLPFDIHNETFFEKQTSFNSLRNNGINILFKTKDLGIKIYKISSEYIQTDLSNSSVFKRFPVTSTCRCLPTTIDKERPKSCDSEDTIFKTSNIYIPFVSTFYSPRLKLYGGYSQDYLDNLFGSGVLTANNFTTQLSYKINPEFPYGCDSEASVTLYNYSNTSWNLSLINFNKNNVHSDVYVSVSEDVDLTAPQLWTQTYSLENGTTNVPFVNAKRFTTSVSINNTKFYAGQSKILYSQASPPNNLAVSLQNPFLESAMSIVGESGIVLYPPSGKLLTNYIFGNRGNETSSVNLTFKKKYRKNILTFDVPRPLPMGTLTQSFFHPHSGLTTGSGAIIDKSAIKDNSINYDASLRNEEYEPGTCFYGIINDRVVNVFNSIENFSIHNKPRLYLFIDSIWYECKFSNYGHFKPNQSNKLYPGKPYFFEYLHNINNSQNIPILYPGCIKKHINFNFLYNHYQYKVLPKPRHKIRQNIEFPLASNIFYTSKTSYATTDPLTGEYIFGISRNKIILPGTRSYFMVPEIERVKNIDIANITQIQNLPSSIANSLKYGDVVKLSDGNRYVLVDPSSPYQGSSYLYTTYTYTDQLYSSMHIDFTSLSKNGYVYNTEKPCNSRIRLYDQKNDAWDTATILKKRIVVKYVDKEGKPLTNLNLATYILIYTEFDLDIPTRNDDYTIVDFIDSKNTTPSDSSRYYHSLILSFITSPVSETDLRLVNNLLPSKWGDVINYDYTIINSFNDNRQILENLYPKPTYPNDFYKIIVNNNKKLEHEYKIFLPNQQSFYLKHDNYVYYNILQKFNIENPEISTIDISKYENYLPFIDLNILSSGDNPLSLWPADHVLSSSINSGHPLTGIINIAGMLTYSKFSDSTINYINPTGDNRYFWINMEEVDMSGTPIDIFRNSNIYTDTLRIDDPLYALEKTQITTATNPNNCRKIFFPKGIKAYSANNSISGPLISNSIPYQEFPIYCDSITQSCQNEYSTQGLRNIGSVKLTSSYRVNDAKLQRLNFPSNTPIPYIISYDAGLYNIIGNESLVKIVRAELPPGNQIEFGSDACVDNTIFPANYKSTTLNPLYQLEIPTNTGSTHSSIVKNTDILANEMLFRIIYGESQLVNKKMYSIDNKILTRDDLINYSENRITAKDIYSQILYNYDKNAQFHNFNINGQFSVKGILTVGATATIKINSLSINLSIQRDVDSDYSTKIFIRGTAGSSIIDTSIYAENIITKRFFVQAHNNPTTTPPPAKPSAPDSNTTIAGPLCSLDIFNRRTFSIWAEGRFDSFFPSHLHNVSVTNGSLADGTEFITRPGIGGCCCGLAGPCGGPCCTQTSFAVDPYDFGLQWACGVQTWGSVNMVPPEYFSIPLQCGPSETFHGTGGGCTLFDIGYLSKTNCPECFETIVSTDQHNFEYSFEYCRTKFDLQGHAYRQMHRVRSTQGIVQKGTVSYSLQTLMEEIQNNSINGVAKLNISDPTTGDITGYKCVPTYGPVGKSCYLDSTTKSCLVCGCPSAYENACVQDFSPEPGFQSINEICVFNMLGGAFVDQNMCSPCLTWPDCFGVFSTKCDKYMNVCGINVGGSRSIKTRKNVFSSTTVSPKPAYNPLCPETLATVSYTSKNITINVGSQTICLSANINKCPEIEISSSMREFSVDDSVSSSCDSCVPDNTKIDILPQKQKFATIREQRKCLLGIKYVANVNPKGLAIFSPGGAGPGGKGKAAVTTQCGGGPVEYGCYEFGATLIDWTDMFMPITVECNQGLPSELTPPLAAYEIPEWEWELNQIQYQRFFYLGKHTVPEDSIIEGVVPGSVGKVTIDAFPLGGSKRTRQAITTGPDILTAYVAYYTYDYIRPATLQDIVRGIAFSSQCDQNGQPISYKCPSLGYPSYYSRDVINQSIFNNGPGHIDGSPYTEQNSTYSKNSDCSASISCYYNSNVLICPSNNYCCYADLGLSNNNGMTSTIENSITKYNGCS